MKWRDILIDRVTNVYGVMCGYCSKRYIDYEARLSARKANEAFEIGQLLHLKLDNIEIGELLRMKFDNCCN